MDEDNVQLYDQVKAIYERYLAVELTYDDFSKPDSNTFANLLVVLLKHLEVDVDSLCQPQIQSSTLFSTNIDAYTNAISQMNIFLISKYVLGIVDENVDFDIFDMVRPRPSKIQPIYEIIVQLVYYKDQTNEIFDSSYTQISTYKNQITSVYEKINDLKLSLPHLRNELLMNQEVVRKYSENFERLKQIFDTKSDEKQGISCKVQENESKRDILLSKIEHNEQKIQDNVTQLEKLKDAMVPYPEVFNNEYQQVKKEMDTLMDSLIKKGHNIDSKRSELLKYVGLENELKAVNVKIKKIQEVNMKINELTAYKNNPTETLNNVENSLISLVKCRNKLLENIKCKKKYLDELEKTVRKLVDTEENEYHEAKRTEYTLTDTLEELNDKKKQLQVQIRNIEQERHIAQVQCEQDKDIMLDKFQTLLNNMESFEHSKKTFQYYNHNDLTDDNTNSQEYSPQNLR